METDASKVSYLKISDVILDPENLCGSVLIESEATKLIGCI